MRLVCCPDAASFLAAAGEFLAERESLHQLPLAVARQCLEDPSRFPGPNLFAVVEEGGLTAGVVVITPPHRVQFYAPPSSAGSVAAALDADGISPPGVHGPGEAADAFALAWCARRALRARQDRSMRAYELTAVIPAPPTPGGMRSAVAGDAETVARWYLAFTAETGTPRSALPPDELGRRAVREGRAFLWEDGAPVAQAVVNGTTPTGARVGGVYTPPDLRRCGYATAVVAALSRRLLDGGRRACYLFTDLANPVSNSIYGKIGYRPVADFRDYEFEALAPGSATRREGTGPGRR